MGSAVTLLAAVCVGVLMVYFIRAGQFGPVKIGFSEDIASRMVKMQADNHERLVVLRIFLGGFLEEAALHQRFSDHRLHGEWFSFSKTMLGDVGLEEFVAPVIEEPPPPPIQIAPEPEPIFYGAAAMEALRAQRGLMSKIAADLGIERAAVAMWRRVPADRVPGVSQSTGLTRHQLRPDLWEETLEVSAP